MLHLGLGLSRLTLASRASAALNTGNLSLVNVAVAHRPGVHAFHTTPSLDIRISGETKAKQSQFIHIYIEVIMIHRPPCQRHDKGQKESGPWAREGQGGQAEEEAGQGAQEDGEEGAPAKTTFRV